MAIFSETAWKTEEGFSIFPIFLCPSPYWCRLGAKSGPSRQQCFPYNNWSFHQNKFSLVVPGRRFTISLSVGKQATGPSTKTTANEVWRTKLKTMRRALNKREEKKKKKNHRRRVIK